MWLKRFLLLTCLVLNGQIFCQKINTKGVEVTKEESVVFASNPSAKTENSSNEDAVSLFDFSPKSGNMLGGFLVNITGLVFNQDDEVVCKFDTTEVPGIVFNKHKAVCVQPLLLIEGYVKLEVTVNGTYKADGQYYAEVATNATNRILFKDKSYDEKSPAEIAISWNRSNLTLNQNVVARISLWGYRETEVGPEVIYIRDLDYNSLNLGHYIIIPEIYEFADDSFRDDFRFGFIQINATELMILPTKVNITRSIWSQPIPLSWYLNPQWEREFGENWPEVLCRKWIKDTTEECPRNLQEALNEREKYTLLDFDANHELYVFSLKQTEQQCRYKNHQLMKSSTKVPKLSQWYNEIAPVFVCCRWQNKYTSDCKSPQFGKIRPI